MKKFLPTIFLLIPLLTSCQVNSSGWPIIPFMHNGTPVQKAPKIDREDSPTFTTNSWK